MFLRPNVFDHSGTGAAADPCNCGCLLHSAAESRWVAIGVTAAGIYIDHLAAAGESEPYTMALLWFTVISMAAIPLFFGAGRRFERDKAKLAAVFG